MLIDIHVHTHIGPQFQRTNASRYPTPTELLAMMDGAGIDRAVVLARVSPECGYCHVTSEEVIEICGWHPERLIPFGNIDPRMVANRPDADFGPLLEYLKELGCRGIGEYIANLPFDDPLQMNVFRHVEAAGLPLIFHIAPAIGGYYGCNDDLGLPRLEKVLKTFPDLKLLGHSQPFWAEISADVTAETRGGYPTGKVTPGRVVQLMRAYPNLYGDLSAGSGCNAVSRDPDFGCAFMEEFQDRLFFGTDICNVPQDLPLVPFFNSLRAEGQLSPRAWEKIAWRNADKLLNLGLAK